ncbi:MAG: hypothetical protein AB2813_01140 [Candidatus Sedimenticola endophacoides]
MIDFASLLKNMDKMNEITKETVEQARAKEPKRICFATIHAAEPKHSTSGSYAGSFNVPFGEGFNRLFPHTLFPNTRDQYHEDSYWLGIESEQDFEEIDAWVKSQGNRVFLRDCLYTSIAMSHNFTDDGERTEIGELEYQAKQNHDMGAVEALAEHCVDTIMDIPLYSKADLVCAIPPRPDKGFDLPSLAVSIVSGKIGKEDITGKFSFGAEKRSVKSATLDEKWDAWNDAAITFNGDLTDKKIILIDDKYQSGTTIQYIAMKLQEAGAHHVLGLSMVKTMRDTDNQ